MKQFLRLTAVVAVVLLVGLTTSNAQEVLFSSAPTPTPNVGGSNGGFAWGDFNGDGYLDVFIPPNNLVYSKSGTSFAAAASTATSVFTSNLNSVGVLAADFNGDGVPDVWNTNNATPATGLYYDSAGVFIAPTGLGTDITKAGGTGSVFVGMAAADIDHSNYLSAAWPNLTIGTIAYADGNVFPKGLGISLLKGGPSGFTQIGKGATAGNLGIDTSRAFESWDVHFFDANNDNYPDLFMPSFRHGFANTNIQVDSVGARKGCILYLNDGTGKFFVPTGATLSRTIYALDSISAAGVRYVRTVADTGIIVDDTVRHFSAIGSQFGDLNNDGNMDLILTGLGATDNMNGFGQLTQIIVIYGKGDGTFTYKWNGTNTVASGLPSSGSIRAWDIGDYNNDQIPDVYASTTFGTTRLFRGNGNGTYSEVTNQDFVVTAANGRAGGLVDYNNDGFLDIYNYTGGASVLQKNGGNSNNWIGFAPVGLGHNMSAIGARFLLYTQGGTYKQYRYIKAEGNAGGHGEMRALFGIGINTSVDSVVVWWPDGAKQTFTGLAINKYWTIKEGSAIPGSSTGLAYPANTATGSALKDTLRWNKASNALSYSVQVSMDPTFANKAMFAVNKIVTDTNYVYSLGGATKYSWRVAAVNGGFVSAYTSPYTFTTTGAVAVAVPIIVTPTAVNKVLKNTIANYNAAPVVRLIIPSGKTLAYYGSFTFRGYFAQGDVGYKFIEVEATQTMPTGHAYASPSTDSIGGYNRAQMGSTAWENITANIKNTVYSATLHDTVYISFGINCAATGNVGGTGVPTIWYADNVTLVDTLGGVGPTENFEGYSVGAPITHIGWGQADDQAVIVNDPVSAGSSGWGANLTLAVNKTADASRYQWQVSSLPTFATYFINDSTADTTRAAQMTGGVTFYLRVRGMNDLGASAFSPVDTFTIVTPPGRPTLSTPANSAQNVITDSVVFTWTKVTGAANYDLKLSTINTTNTYTALTDTSLKVRSLAKLTNYTWAVEANNIGGTSYFTANNSFTTVIAAPAAPAVLLPASSATGVNRLSRFTWTPTANATKYRLQVATDNAFTQIVADTVGYDTAIVLSTPLASNTAYFWQMNAQNIGGASAYSTARLFTTGTVLSVAKSTTNVPTEFALMQNYPNPFNPSTTIQYSIPKTAYVTLKVYDVLGRLVTTLVDGVKEASFYQVQWNASAVSSGVYFYRVDARSQDGSKNFTSVKKLILMK